MEKQTWTPSSSSLLKPTEADMRDALRSTRCSHAERCRSVLLSLLSDLVAFVQRRQRQQQQQQETTNHALFSTVQRVCEARIAQLQRTSDDELLPPSSTSLSRSPRELVAEAMAQELLVSLASIRMAEKEALVLEELESVETLRQLHARLRRDEAQLRRAVRAGAGDDAQLRELQALVRDELLHEMAQSRAEGLAESLHNEASLQFAWETIQDQKKEIVRLRAENEQLRRRPLTREQGREAGARDPKQAIRALRAQLSSHQDSNLRLLQDHIQSLETALQQQQQQQFAQQQQQRQLERSRRLEETIAKPLSAVTVDSSRDGRGSVLSPSHLTGASPSRDRDRDPDPDCDCRQCAAHVRSIVSLQSELKQLRAQSAADDDALVRAEREQTHLKREHAALTSALLTAKQQQQELRQTILEITDEKLALQTATEAQQRTADRTLTLLRRQLEELEQWRERRVSEQRELDDTCRRLTAERDDATQTQQRVQRECDELTIRAHAAEASLREAKAELAVMSATAQEHETLTRELEQALERATRQANDAEDARNTVQRQWSETNDRLATALAEIERLRRDHDATAASNEQLVSQVAFSSEKHTQLEREVATLREETVRLERLSQRWQRDADAKRQQLAAVQMHATRVEEQLMEVESELLSRSIAVETSEQRVEALEAEVGVLRTTIEERELAVRELEQQMGVTQQRETQEREALASCRLELQQLRDRLSADASTQEQSLASLHEENASLTQELAETKTTILMWMSKYHAMENERTQLSEALEQQRQAAEQETRQFLDVEQRLRTACERLERSVQTQGKEIETLCLALERERRDKRESVVAWETRVSEMSVQRSWLQAAIAEERERSLAAEEDAIAQRRRLQESMETQREEHARAMESVRRDYERERERQRVEMEELHAQVTEQLVEIGVLQADKRLLVEDCESLRKGTMRLEQRMDAMAMTGSQAVEQIQRGVYESLMAMERQWSYLLESTRAVEARLKTATTVISVLVNQQQQKRQARGSKVMTVVCDAAVQVTLVRQNAHLDQQTQCDLMSDAAVENRSRLSLSQQSTTDAAPVVPLLPPEVAFQLKPNKESTIRRESVTRVLALGMRHAWGFSRRPPALLVAPQSLGVAKRRRSSVVSQQELSSAYVSDKRGSDGVWRQWRELLLRVMAKSSLQLRVSALRFALTEQRRLHATGRHTQTLRRWETLVRAMLRAAQSRWRCQALTMAMREKLVDQRSMWRWQSLSSQTATQTLWRRRVLRLLIVSLKQRVGERRLRAALAFLRWRFQTARFPVPAIVSTSASASSSSSSSHLSSSVVRTMRECVILLSQFCAPSSADSLQSPQTPSSPSPSSADSSVQSFDSQTLAELLLTSTRHVVAWRDTIESKLRVLQARERQLERLQTHCQQLQALVTTLQQRSPAPGDSLRRRQLNEANVTMLEGVIRSLEEAKTTRVRLHAALERKSQRITRLERQIATLESRARLSRAFYHWRRLHSKDNQAT
ncbi:hypothetical protein PINS_up000049 [Pythium insidiosum]|nr:hypothetical protein PINS_up000049 [Pythium insidiosum]